MKKLWWLLAALLSTGCAVLDAPVGSNPFAPTSPPRPVMAATQAHSATPTATATDTPAPTPDYSAVWPAQTQAQAVAMQAQAEATKAAAASTLVQATVAGLQNALLASTPTALAIQTAHAWQTEQAHGQQQAAYLQQENARIMAAIEKERKDAENKRNVIFAAQVSGLALAVIAGLFTAQTLAYRAQTAVWKQQVERDMSVPLQHIAPPSDFVQVTPARKDTAKVPVDHETFAVWASRMLGGETAGVNKWEGSDSPFYGKRAGYVPFLAEMERRGYVAEMPGRGKVLTEIGRAYCAGWLARRGYTPPPQAEAHESAENGMNHAMPCPPDADAEGETR